MSYAEDMGHDCYPGDGYFDTFPEDGYGPVGLRGRRRGHRAPARATFDYDPDNLYYHERRSLGRKIHETEKAYLFEYRWKKAFWIPKSLIRGYSVDQDDEWTAWVWKGFKPKYFNPEEKPPEQNPLDLLEDDT